MLFFHTTKVQQFFETTKHFLLKFSLEQKKITYHKIGYLFLLMY
jgi:hypothetical protein